MDTPWNPDTKLLHIGIKGYELAIEDRPPVNLVFLIDTSGSMQDSDKLPLLINSFRLMLANLQPDDKVAIVTYAGSAGTVLEPTSASDSTTILASLERLYAGGSTAGQAGLQQAYALAEQMADGNEATSRVILATDGDFNVGISDPEALKEYVEDKRESGVYLSVLGFGRGNYNDALMQTLAQNGNGTAAYIDTLAEAQKVLVDQIGGALFTIAQDVKIQVEFNPAEIAEYRLIGYETRALNREDFNNDAVDAGEIGAGHTVTAIYEITPVGSPAVMVDDLRYGTDEVGSLNTGEYAFLKLRYKNPGEDVSNLITTPITPDADAELGGEAEFAAAVAGFGQILRGDNLMHGWEVSDARALAQASKGEDRFGYRSELITLMRLAESLK
jgi:Ca-activated chloride channel family protein